MKVKHKIVNFTATCFIVILAFAPSNVLSKKDFEEEQYGVKYASPCEVCKIMVTELDAKLVETGKNPEILQTSYHMEANKDTKKKEYKKSQVRLIESMETTCEAVLTYNVHKERKDSTRFARGQSQTFSTLHGLVNKGVKVDLGIPFEMWDKPAAEITDLKSKCENMMEKYESEIEEWYNQGEQIPLADYLCRKIVLKGKNDKCLDEKEPPIQIQSENKDNDENNKQKKKRSKKGEDEL